MGKLATNLHTFWVHQNIGRKIAFFTGGVSIIIFLSILSSFLISKIAVNDINIILNNNSRSIDFIDTIEHEGESFRLLMKEPSEENKDKFINSCLATQEAIDLLPFDYNTMSIQRFAKTWSVKNSYTVYKEQRDKVVNMTTRDNNYISEVYKTYEMQQYLQEYGRSLMRYTLEDGVRAYHKNQYILKVIIYIFIVGFVLYAIMFFLSRLIKKSIVTPIFVLVHAAERIAENDFYFDDIKVENKDELGRLVASFNKMKYATGQYIATLEDKRKTMDLLHKEELEKIDMTRRFINMKFEALKNQINPHFLFNTLNMIGGMATLEEANTTEQMIIKLSSLLRYNLKTTKPIVFLKRELEALQNYMYLQQMRFGSRVRYEVDCKVNAEQVLIPAFLLQPLVENSIIHGLSHKEEGGKIFIRIWSNEKEIIITVVDSGVGIPSDQLSAIKKEMEIGRLEERGIGLSNIYNRVCKTNIKGEFYIFSRENIGTAIKIVIPILNGGEIACIES